MQFSWNSISLSILLEDFPESLFPAETVPGALKLLEENRKIEVYDGGYRLRLPHIEDWLAGLKDNVKQTVALRLQNKTLEECGQVMGITRERVRQIVSREAKRKPTLREDEFAYWFREYDVDEEAMSFIFGVTPEVYSYFSAVYNKGKKDVDDIPSDSNITQRIAVNYQKYLNRNNILFEGEYVPAKRDLLCRRLAGSICAEEDISYRDFYAAYLKLLASYGLEKEERLL